ncbi:MAG: OmpA family protein [Pyrinomonadaceae bacterium]|nr:OmpA family protein [Pyrinomonadaceae bacterium]
MNLPGFVAHRKRVVAVALLLFAVTHAAFAQSDVQRETVAISYPLDNTVSVKFRGTTQLPRLSGEAKIRRTARRGTRIELSIDNLPRATELGGPYTTYVLWAISPEGRIDNLGEIKRSNLFIINSKLDVTTPLQTFALVVTAEPHFLVRGPSRIVVLENLPPRNPGEATIATVNVQYLGNTSDYLNNTTRAPEVADRDYAKTPTALLGARQAVQLARYAGAERDASDEYKQAQAALETAENAWRLKQSESETDALARQATSLGARAEEVAEARKAARLRREDVQRRDEAVRDAERSTATAETQIAELRTSLDRETRARELVERDLAGVNQQVRDMRTENERLRGEVAALRTEAEDARVKLARIEGERAAEESRQRSQQQTVERQASADSLKNTLRAYGTVRETARGLVLVLPESLWASARSSEFAPTAATKLEPLAALFANNPDYQLVIETFTDNRGDASVLQQLTQERAGRLAQNFTAAGLDAGRVQASGMGATKPIASNANTNGRSRNRRTEITIVSNNAASSTGAGER